MKEEYINKIKDAEMILVGIGEEFEIEKYNCDNRAIEALKELLLNLEGKNYFIISTCTNSILDMIGFKEERVVNPCGTMHMKQCENCKDTLCEITEQEKALLKEAVSLKSEIRLGVCPVCGKAMVLNNVYIVNYDENGYLDKWTIYKKWLQGTINRKVCILELGVGLVFPSVIRWPFEKIAFYNQKSEFIRVNERLYHMSEELKEKGISVAKNSIDWLLEKEL